MTKRGRFSQSFQLSKQGFREQTSLNQTIIEARNLKFYIIVFKFLAQDNIYPITLLFNRPISSKGETKRGLNLPRCRNFQGLGLGTSVTKITNHFHLRSRSHCHFSKEGEEEGEGLKLGRGDWGGGGEQVRRWRRLKSSEVGYSQVFWVEGVSLVSVPLSESFYFFPLLSQSDNGGPQSTKKS